MLRANIGSSERLANSVCFVPCLRPDLSNILILRFSGDTKPTNNLVRAGQNATVLIHEATMGDDQEEMAAQKAHSTIGQAIKIGKE